MFQNVVISGVGSAIPNVVVKNSDFINHEFLNEDGTLFDKENKEIIEKFKGITGIEERRYAENTQNASDLAAIAAKNAILDADIDQEDLDLIIVAHNFGDVDYGSLQGDFMPSLASKVKHHLNISNPNCVAFDILFGCPGWVQGMIQAYHTIKVGDAKKALVIGTETLSRVVDKYDRDAMIFADGAGATVIELKEEDSERGFLSSASQTYANEEANFLYNGSSYAKQDNSSDKYIKMLGRKIYEFALTKVPAAMKVAMDKRGIEIDDIKKIFLHQANEKMDEQIVKRFYRLYRSPILKDVMPMSIAKLGNNSVATVPVLLDLVLKGELEPHKVQEGDIAIFASVGAGMNINAITYKF